jgi:hypothetical protein
MILPIMAAINREVFLQTPALHEEAALALGATRWEMIRMTVIPYGKSGVIGGAMLGLGRALGETIAVLLVLSASGGISLNLIGQANPPTIPSNIAAQFPEATGSTSTCWSRPGWCCSSSPSRSTSPPAPWSHAAPSSTEQPDERPDPRPAAVDGCRRPPPRCPTWAAVGPRAVALVVALACAPSSAAARS